MCTQYYDLRLSFRMEVDQKYIMTLGFPLSILVSKLFPSVLSIFHLKVTHTFKLSNHTWRTADWRTANLHPSCYKFIEISPKGDMYFWNCVTMNENLKKRMYVMLWTPVVQTDSNPTHSHWLPSLYRGHNFYFLQPSSDSKVLLHWLFKRARTQSGQWQLLTATTWL